MPFSTHGHANEHCLPLQTNQLNISQNLIFQTQDEHLIRRFFLSLSSIPHIALTMDLLVLRNIHISLSFRRYHHSSHNFSSYSTASPIFPSHFPHVIFLEHFGVTLFTPAHLPWIHLPHCEHKAELAFISSCRPHMDQLYY